MSLTFEHTGTKPCVAKSIGDIHNILDGKVPEDLKDKRLDAEAFLCGFEAGSTQDFASMGEAMAMNGLLFASRTDRRDVKDRLLWGRRFVTAGFFGIPKDSTPTARLFVDGEETVETLYTAILQEMKSPCCIVGSAFFSKASLTSLSAPPIYAEALFDHKEKYFKEGVQEMIKMPALLVGVATDYHEKSFSTANETLQKVLYHNPFGDTKAIASHTHVLMMRREIPNIQQLHPDDAIDVYHLLPSSVIARASLLVFAVECVDGL